MKSTDRGTTTALTMHPSSTNPAATSPAVTRAAVAAPAPGAGGDWAWLLSALLFLMLLLALPAQAGAEAPLMPVGKAERVLAAEPALLSSHEVTRQWRRHHQDDWLDAEVATPLELPFLAPGSGFALPAVLLLVLVFAVSAVTFSSLPGLVRPGAPRGPPAAAFRQQ